MFTLFSNLSGKSFNEFFYIYVNFDASNSPQYSQIEIYEKVKVKSNILDIYKRIGQI